MPTLQTFKDGYLQLQNAIVPTVNFNYSVELASVVSEHTRVIDELEDVVVDNVNKIGVLTTDLSEKANETDATRTTTSKTVTGSINELNSKKASKYDGGITDFNTALTQGKYTFGNTATNGYKAWYGEVDIIVSGGGTHDNSTNWIWQIAYYTDGVIAYRSKYNSDAWSAWKLIATTDSTTLTFLNGWAIGNDSNDVLTVTRSGGIISLKGTIKAGTVTQAIVIANLPTSFRSSSLIRFMGIQRAGTGKAVSFYINTNGDICYATDNPCNTNEIIDINVSFKGV